MEQPFHAMMERYLTGSLSPEERQAFIEWMASGQFDHELDAIIDQAMQQNQFEVQHAQQLKELLYRQLSAGMEERQVVSMIAPATLPFYRRYRWVAAVFLILLSGTAGYLLLSKRDRPEKTRQAMAAKPDVQPGRDGAILTLADGSSVVLDSMGNGIIAEQAGAQVVLRNGQLVYAPAAQNKNESIAYNTMTTPKGRQFVLSLPDGTRVWMNAASSIRYPTRFSGKERKVAITGEVYFEVAKDERKPFIVAINDLTDVEVMGTHFNVNAYDDESEIRTTLLEGSVRIRNGAAEQRRYVLAPGQQALIAKPGNDKAPSSVDIIHDADLAKVMAWKNGAFNFDNASLGEVMRQLARWYDITIEYPQGLPTIEFEGKISRNTTLSGILNILDRTGVHFRLEQGKRLIVLP